MRFELFRFFLGLSVLLPCSLATHVCETLGRSHDAILITLLVTGLLLIYPTYLVGQVTKHA